MCVELGVEVEQVRGASGQLIHGLINSLAMLLPHTCRARLGFMTLIRRHGQGFMTQ